MRKLFLSFLFALLSISAWAENDSISYVPKVHGVFRGRWEIETVDGYSHFQVRNARISLDGNVAPIISYKINVDLCDRGKFSFLDAYAKITPVKNLDLQVGQYRMPFGIESFLGPGSYYFNNRSYIGKQVNNYRAVGVSVGYTLKQQPVTFETGIFNPTMIDDHTGWVKKYAYAGRVMYKPGDWLVAGGFESIMPEKVRINLASATLGWGHDRFYIEGEYMVRWYTHKAHKTTYAYNLFAVYNLPLKKSFFDTLSFQTRFDGMTNLASGYFNDILIDGKLPTTAVGRRRLTLGSTLDYKFKFIRVAVRLNYEKCWFNHSVEYLRGDGDVISAELIVKF